MVKNIKKNLDIRSDHLEIKKIEGIFFIVMMFAVILPFGLCALKWMLPYIPTQILFEMLLTMIVCLCIYKISKVNTFVEVEFEGDFNSLSSILHKQLKFKILERIDSNYIFKSQNYLLPDSSYIVMDLGNYCKIIAREHLGIIKKVFNQNKLEEQA